MAQHMSNFNIAGTFGIVFCAVFTGANLAISNVTVPVLLLTTSTTEHESDKKHLNESRDPVTQPRHIARQWQSMYNIGSKAGPVVSLGGLSSFVMAAWGLPHSSTLQYRLFLAAAGLSVAILPFTLLFMKRLNDEIHRRANSKQQSSTGAIPGGDGKLGDRSTPELIRRWARLNLMRASLHVAAIACGMAAIFM